ncbi:Fur family transcriptional regulator [Sphingomonas morindae]|uniref:Transcriptional repressor n=1 Tax=Sphingomonas morindae TaxID=1541170 RepID=A0ABY4X4W4_9SPHN|nr:transcriptional repressor [Sphingomonas morindae]USI71900.1 transcriptional repressor [Sphingomonas morindae]
MTASIRAAAPVSGPPHAHRLPEGAALAEAARAALESRGEQWTQLRAAVFESLGGFDRPASAYDIAEDLSRRQERRVAANSIYRILDLFVASNVAQRIESANAYVANPHPGCRHDCIFLVCARCGVTLHLDDDAIAGQVRAAAAAAGFRAERPVIEVRGLCPACTAGGGD